MGRSDGDLNIVGEAMRQNKEGVWRPVSQMSDPNRQGGDSGRRYNPQVGRWGETVSDRYAADHGWEKINGPPQTLTGPFGGPRRIDAIYRDPGPPPRYIVSDSKALGAGQGTTGDKVLQMSDEWIQDRLGNAGLSAEQLEDLALGYDPVLLKVDKNGKVTEVWLDEAGKPIPAPSWRNE